MEDATLEILENEIHQPPFVINQFSPVLPLTQLVGWGLNKLGIDTIHSAGFTGRGIRVAVLDTRVDHSHPDLVGAVIKSLNTTNEADTVALGGHGTAVAGIIGARNNTTGILGYAPDCEIVAIKVMKESGSGDISDIVEGIDLAVSEKCNIINLSLGTSYDYPGMRDAVKRATDAGILVVCAAGNDGTTDSVNYPGRYPLALAVAAIRESGNISAFSSMGWDVDLACAGESIVCPWKNGGYVTISGTSFASPACAGILALLLQAGLQITQERLYETCIDIESPGRDVKAGYGLINPNGYITKYTPPVLPGDPNQKIEAAIGHIAAAIESGLYSKKLLEDFLAGIK